MQDSANLDLSPTLAAEVHRFVARRVANQDDAADIAQQALLQAWTKRSSCRGDNVSAWLLTIARHLIVDHFRARHRVQLADVDALAETDPALRTAPDAVWAMCEGRARLATWLDCLNRRLHLEGQVAVLLADVHGYRDKDSARFMRMSLPSFKLLLHEARMRVHGIAGARFTPVESAHGSRSGPPTWRASVSCGLARPLLLDLRDRLFEGLPGQPAGKATAST